MKHNLKVTYILLAFFMLSQFFGLFVINYDMTKSVDIKTNQTIASFSETSIGERPQIQGVETLIFLSTAIIFGTILVLILAKFRKRRVWKVWFFLAIWMTISITLGVFIPSNVALIIALIIALYKVLKPNFYIHNFSEILVYSGMAFLLSPLVNVFWGIMLLLVISVYDAFAVWQSKHMIKLAVFQRDSNSFAGLHINYEAKKNKEQTIKKSELSKNDKIIKTKQINSAVLGGGDMAFPLIFTGSVMTSFFIQGASKIASFVLVSPIVIFSTISLGFLLYYGKKEKFYPAMPFLTAGVLIGFALSSLAFHIFI